MELFTQLHRGVNALAPAEEIVISCFYKANQAIIAAVSHSECCGPGFALFEVDCQNRFIRLFFIGEISADFLENQA